MEIPNKVWLIVGHRPARNLKNHAYTTDPRSYDLPGLKQMTDEEYTASADRVKAFIKRDDAIDFAYECGLESTMVLGFRLVDGKYEEDRSTANEVLDIDW